MAKMMKASVVEQFGQPLKIRELPIPKSGPGQALIVLPDTRIPI